MTKVIVIEITDPDRPVLEYFLKIENQTQTLELKAIFKYNTVYDNLFYGNLFSFWLHHTT